MYACTSCKIWLHEECLIADIKKKLYKEIAEGPSSPTKNNQKEGSGEEDEGVTAANKARGKKRTSGAAATVSIANSLTPKSSSARGKNIAAGGDKEDFFQVAIRPEVNGPVVAAVRDLRSRKEWGDRGGKWEEGVGCLGCGKIIS